MSLSRRHLERRNMVAGMALLDVLVAIFLIVIGGAALMALQIVLIRANLAARQLSEATDVARMQMERMLYTTTLLPSGSDTVDVYGCSSLVACTQRGIRYERTWTLTQGSPNQVRVTVSWTDPAGQSHRVVLDGLR